MIYTIYKTETAFNKDYLKEEVYALNYRILNKCQYLLS